MCQWPYIFFPKDSAYERETYYSKPEDFSDEIIASKLARYEKFRMTNLKQGVDFFRMTNLVRTS